MNCLLPVTQYDIKKRTTLFEQWFLSAENLEKRAKARRNAEYRHDYAQRLKMAKIAARLQGFEVEPDIMSEHGCRAVKFRRERGVKIAEWFEMDRFGAIPNPDRPQGSITRSVTESQPENRAETRIDHDN